jgi:hypothetical protein
MARQKRTNGTGSVYQRKDGSLVASVVMGGERISRYRRNRKDAELVLASLLSASEASVPRSTQRKSVPTLDEWANQWLEINASRLQPKTLSNYRKSLNPVLELDGDARLAELTPFRLAGYLTQLRHAGRGGCSIQRTYTVLRTCLEAAVTLDCCHRIRWCGSPNHNGSHRRNGTGGLRKHVGSLMSGCRLPVGGHLCACS